MMNRRPPIQQRKKFIPKSSAVGKTEGGLPENVLRNPIPPTEPPAKPRVRKPILPKIAPKVEIMKVDSIQKVAQEMMKKPLPKVKVHPLLLKADSELKPYERKKLDIYHEFEGNIKLEDIFVDPINGVELFRTSYGTWATSPGY